MPTKNIMRGYDTESTSDGVTQIASFNDNTMYKPEGFTFEDFMEFLFTPRKNTKPIMTYNLKYEIGAILRTMPKEVCEQLYHEINVDYKGYRITLIPYKRLSFVPINTQGIKRTTPNKPHPYNQPLGKSLFDVASFLTYATLKQASEEFLGKRKYNYAYDWVKEMQNCKTVEDEIEELDRHKDEVCVYCKVDAKLTLELAEKLKEKYAEIGVPFNRPMSQANVLKSWLGRQKHYPTISREAQDLSTETAGWYEPTAQRAYHGGMFLTNQRGVFDNVYEADLNSAYPKTLSELPNWKNGVFVEPVFKEDYYSAKYGWYLCQFDCQFIPYKVYKEETIIEWVEGEPIEISLAPVRRYYVTGKRKQWITALEYRWLIQHGYKVKWLQGIIWQQRTEEFEKPFGWIPEFYRKRREYKQAAKEGDKQAEMMQHVLKITMNSSYGITAQQQPKFTKFTNFFYASYVTADCLTKVIDFIQNDPDNVIQIATDGVLMKEKPMGLKIGTELGEWSMDRWERVVIVGNGIKQAFNDHSFEKWGYSTKARGITSIRDYDLYGAMVANLTGTVVTNSKRRPIGLGELLQSRKMPWSDLNTFKTFERRIDVNGDCNRKWSREYKCWGDFLIEPTTSKPLRIKDVEK